MKHLLWLIRRDFVLELRQPQLLSGIVLHALGSVWITYLAFKGMIPPDTWNGLLWVILLFSAIHATGRTFGSDSAGRRLYYYTLASPRNIILAKIVYNTLLILLLGMITSLLYFLFNGNPIRHFLPFTLALILGTIGLSGILTFTSGLAAQEGRNFSLMAILSLPVSAPMLLLLIRLSSLSLQPLAITNLGGLILALLLLDLISIALAWILFPYLWKE
ncbi:MAG: heme exporter protein CcmB [Bacteroidales bacterium]